MIHLQKEFEIRSYLESCRSSSNLIMCAFQDCPDLHVFAVAKTNEYDDNNYSDYIRLLSVNGYYLDYEGGYDAEYDEENNNDLPMIKDKSIIYNLMDLAGSLNNHFDYGEEIEVLRDSYLGDKPDGFKPRRVGRLEKARKRYVLSYLSGKKLPDSFFLKNDARYAVFYALDHGRFSPDVEFKIFAKEGKMGLLLDYAKHVAKCPLGEEVENFFLLNDSKESEDHAYLVQYIEFKNSCLENSV